MGPCRYPSKPFQRVKSAETHPGLSQGKDVGARLGRTPSHALGTWGVSPHTGKDTPYPRTLGGLRWNCPQEGHTSPRSSYRVCELRNENNTFYKTNDR